MATDPDPDLTSGWSDRGGDVTATWTEIPMGWAPTDEEGLALAHQRMRFALPGWKVMSELPNPVNFEAATALATPDDMSAVVPYGPDPARYVATIKEFVDAGFEHLAVMPVGDDVQRTIEFFTNEVRPLL